MSTKKTEVTNWGSKSNYYLEDNKKQKKKSKAKSNKSKIKPEEEGGILGEEEEAKRKQEQKLREFNKYNRLDEFSNDGSNNDEDQIEEEKVQSAESDLEDIFDVDKSKELDMSGEEEQELMKLVQYSKDLNDDQNIRTSIGIILKALSIEEVIDLFRDMNF